MSAGSHKVTSQNRYWLNTPSVVNAGFVLVLCFLRNFIGIF